MTTRTTISGITINEPSDQDRTEAWEAAGTDTAFLERALIGYAKDGDAANALRLAGIIAEAERAARRLHLRRLVQRLAAEQYERNMAALNAGEREIVERLADELDERTMPRQGRREVTPTEALAKALTSGCTRPPLSGKRHAVADHVGEAVRALAALPDGWALIDVQAGAEAKARIEAPWREALAELARAAHGIYGMNEYDAPMATARALLNGENDA